MMRRNTNERLVRKTEKDIPVKCIGGEIPQNNQGGGKNFSQKKKVLLHMRRRKCILMVWRTAFRKKVNSKSIKRNVGFALQQRGK